MTTYIGRKVTNFLDVKTRREWAPHMKPIMELREQAYGQQRMFKLKIEQCHANSTSYGNAAFWLGCVGGMFAVDTFEHITKLSRCALAAKFIPAVGFLGACYYQYHMYKRNLKHLEDNITARGEWKKMYDDATVLLMMPFFNPSISTDTFEAYVDIHTKAQAELKSTHWSTPLQFSKQHTETHIWEMVYPVVEEEQVFL